MEFQEVVRKRKMVRSFEDRPVPHDVVERMLTNAQKAPSAGFSQGWGFLVLEGKEETARYFDALWPRERRAEFGWPDFFNAPVLSMKELAYDPDLRESGTIVEVAHKQRGPYLTVGSPMKFSGFKPTITGSPLLGEHTDEVLAQLGYGPEQIARLHQAEVVGPPPPEPVEHGQPEAIRADKIRAAAAD